MSTETTPCASCGRPVPPRESQKYPYPGHKPDCALMFEWLIRTPHFVVGPVRTYAQPPATETPQSETAR